MFLRQSVSIGNLLLDASNYRIVKQDSQKAARDAIIAEQDKKLVVLAKDIIKYGLNPFDLPLVIDADDGNHNFIVIEGNRRITAIHLMLKPELAEGTSIHTAFKRLNIDHSDSIPKVIECVIAPNKKAGFVWIERKHLSGMEGAGTEPWQAMAKARADEEEGIARADLDAVNFVLSNPNLPSQLRATLQGSKFPITTLRRLVDSKEMQQSVGISVQKGRLISDQDKGRVQAILTDIIEIVAVGKHKGQKFTERSIDSREDREKFIGEIAAKHPKKSAPQHWQIGGSPVNVKKREGKAKKPTPSTEEQPNLIPRPFKLELPSGKINDIFVELKTLDVVRYRHSVSVLLRVFFEMSLDDYIKKHGIQLATDKKGYLKDTLLDKLNAVTGHAKTSKLLSDKELKPIFMAIGNKNSFLSPETLNAYVHSTWMNPDPLQLKLSWGGGQLFLERLWTSKKSDGQP